VCFGFSIHIHSVAGISTESSKAWVRAFYFELLPPDHDWILDRCIHHGHKVKKWAANREERALSVAGMFLSVSMQEDTTNTCMAALGTHCDCCGHNPRPHRRCQPHHGISFDISENTILDSQLHPVHFEEITSAIFTKLDQRDFPYTSSLPLLMTLPD
jgi:hypothetical protein